MSKASLLELCHAEKMYEIVNKHVKNFNISIYRHLQKCLYKGLCPKLSTNNQARLNSWVWRLYPIYLTVAGIFSACDQINFRANECRAKLVWAMSSAAGNHEINRIGNMPTFSISHEQSKLAWTLPCRENVWNSK